MVGKFNISMKIFVLVTKVTPMLLAFCHLINILLNYFYDVVECFEEASEEGRESDEYRYRARREEDDYDYDREMARGGGRGRSSGNRGGRY